MANSAVAFPAKSETRDKFQHFATITTRWRDNDVYQHVNNTVYYSWIDTTIADYLVKFGGLDYTTSPVIGFVVEGFCQYRAPVAYPDVVEAGLRVAHLGSSSARYEVGIFRQGDDEAAAIGYLVHVFVDRETHAASAIPDSIRTALESLRNAA